MSIVAHRTLVCVDFLPLTEVAANTKFVVQKNALYMKHNCFFVFFFVFVFFFREKLPVCVDLFNRYPINTLMI